MTPSVFRFRAPVFLALLTALSTGCPSEAPEGDAGPGTDAGVARADAGTSDAGRIVDGGQTMDAGADAGTATDAGAMDAGAPDAGAALDAGSTADAGPLPAARCAPLPAPDGMTIMATPADALHTIVDSAPTGSTVMLADGTYTLTRQIRLATPGVTLRSASGNAAAVVLDATYTVNEAVVVSASDVTIAHFTVTHAVDHGVRVTGPSGGPDVLGFLMHDVTVTDCGEQFVKINPPASRDAQNDEGTIRCSTFILTDDGRPHIERSTGGCYTGGIDAHRARDWVIADNHFEGIYCAGEGLAEHAIHFWRGSRDTLVERNTIVNCARGIGLGLANSGEARTYPDAPEVGYIGHLGGLVRGNMLFSDIAYYDTGIELNSTHGARVLHNTVVSAESATGRYSAIDARFSSTDVLLQNNIARRFTVRNGATTTRVTNLEAPSLSLFVDAANADLHLTPGATGARGQGTPHAEAGMDVDGDAFDMTAPHIGADAQ